VLIDCCNLVSATILALRLIIEEFAVIGYVLYPAMCGLLNALVVDYPRDVWWRLANDLNVKVK